MSPARLASSPQSSVPRGEAPPSAHGFFPGPQAFPAANSPKSVTPGGSFGGEGLSPPVVGQRLWLLARGSARSPFPGVPPVAGAPLALVCLPCAPTLPRAPLPGSEKGWFISVTLLPPFCPPPVLLARSSGWVWGGAAEQLLPQLRLGSVVFSVLQKAGFSPRWRGPAPLGEPSSVLRAELQHPRPCSCSCVRIWSLDVLSV